MTSKKNEIRVLDDLELKEMSGGFIQLLIAFGITAIGSAVIVGTLSSRAGRPKS